MRSTIKLAPFFSPSDVNNVLQLGLNVKKYDCKREYVPRLVAFKVVDHSTYHPKRFFPTIAIPTLLSYFPKVTLLRPNQDTEV